MGWSFWDYLGMNQMHDPSNVSQVHTYQRTVPDDRNAAAVISRGPNTSLNHYAGVNFQEEPPHLQHWAGVNYEDFFRGPRLWHFATAHVRNEPTYITPPVSRSAFNRSRN